MADTTKKDQEAELARQADVEKAVHNLVYFGDGTPRQLPPEPEPEPEPKGKKA